MYIGAKLERQTSIGFCDIILTMMRRGFRTLTSEANQFRVGRSETGRICFGGRPGHFVSVIKKLDCVRL